MGKKEFCPLEQCEWANPASGHCLWPGRWCPHQRKKEQRRVEWAHRQMAHMQQEAERASEKRTHQLIQEYEEGIQRLRARREELAVRYREMGEEQLAVRIRQLDLSLRNLEYAAGEMSRTLCRRLGRSARSPRRWSGEW